MSFMVKVMGMAPGPLLQALASGLVSLGHGFSAS